MIESGIYAFGRNNEGQLGLENKIEQLTPQLISSLKKETIKKIACGYGHTMIITGNFYFHSKESETGLFSFGFNKYGQLGSKDNINVDSPILVSKNVKNVACGDYFTMIVK
jgi:RCC1 and BTB domain-containing protein